jgi:uncharacterized protein (TIGR02118 family)
MVAAAIGGDDMAKLKLAVWRDPGRDAAGFQRDLVAAWAASALERPQVTGLILHQADPRSDPNPAAVASEDSPPDAVISLWLDGTELGAFRAAALAGESVWRPAGARRVDAWLVREVRAKTYDRSWPDGVASPGVTQYSLVRPAPGRSREACSLYWREQHVPLALRIHVGLWNYVQDHVVETLTEAGSDVLGHAALHFRSAEDLRENLFDSEAGARKIYADIPRFMSLEDSQTALMTELILRTPAPHLT